MEVASIDAVAFLITVKALSRVLTVRHINKYKQRLIPPQLLKTANMLHRKESRICARNMESLQYRPIYHATLKCNELFADCITQIAEPRTSSLIGESAVAIGRLAREHQARFCAWSSYLGVFAEQDVCLDRRLSSSQDIRAMVMDLLRIIAVSLRHC